MRHLVILAAVASSIVLVERAQACTDTAGTAPPCSTGWFQLPYDKPVPANVPAIPFAIGGGIDPSLLDEAGALWPTTVISDESGRRFLVPSKTLSENAKWTIDWLDPCGTSARVQRTFSTSTIHPLPTKLGTVTATLRRASVSVTETSCGTSRSIYLAGPGTGRNGASLEVELSAELVPFEAVTTFEVLLDGRPHYGRSIWTPCDTLTAPSLAPTTPGRHVLSMRAVVANLAPTPWVQTEVTLSCEGDGGGSGVTPDSGAASADAGRDAGPDAAAAADGETVQACGFAAGVGAPSMAAVLGVAFAGLASRARRRRSRSGSGNPPHSPSLGRRSTP